MKVKLHSTKNENESAASCASVPVAPSAPEFHREARAAASSKNNMNEITVSKLEREERCGDWHDKPLRWVVTLGSKCQKFSTKRDAQKYASLWRRNNGDEFATFAAWQKTYCV